MTHKKSKKRQPIILPITKEMHDLGFKNIRVEWSEEHGKYILKISCQVVVVSQGEPQKIEDKEMEIVEFEKLLSNPQTIRDEFEKQNIDRNITERFVLEFSDILRQQKEDEARKASKMKRIDGKEEGDDDDGDDNKKKYYIQKYTNGDFDCRSGSAEAVLVGGIPYFLQIADGKPLLSKEITDIPDMVLKPLDRISYLSKEYSFQSIDQIDDYIKRANEEETLDTLYQKVKSILEKYIDADKDHIAICAADTIFTYFQDRLGMTHYLLFVGDNTTGKSNNLRVFQYLGYRPLFDTSITPANIFRFLGSIEEGQGIILEDEIDDIDQQEGKMKIYKVGYNSGAKVSRIDTSFGIKQQSFWTYCFKAFSAERQPDSNKAKGFNERVFVIKCSTGNPQYDIAEVINPAGDEQYKSLLEELLELRNLLLVYRLLHHNSPIQDIKLNIKNRDKQLCKPLIRLFQNSNAVNEILVALSKFVSEKKQRKVNTLEARLYTIITELVASYGTTLTSALIWDTFKADIDGSDISAQSYETSEYGVISQKKIVEILEDRFGAYKKRSGRERTLIFDKDKLSRLAANYSLSTSIEILKSNKEDEENGQDEVRAVVKQPIGIIEESSRSSGDTYDACDTSIDNTRDNFGLIEIKQSDNSSDLTRQYQENDQNNANISTHTSGKQQDKTQYIPMEASQASQALSAYTCYHCDDYKIDDKSKYEYHTIHSHPNKPAYPSKFELEFLSLKPQGKSWEI
jgi:hypothetical protein